MTKFLFTLFLLAFSFSYSQDWKLISENNDSSYYYKPNTDNTAWIREFSEKIKYYPNKKSIVAKYINGYTLTLFKFECDEKKIGFQQVNTYSIDGKLVDNYSQNEYLVNMDYVVPDSLGETFLNAFCNKEN